MTAIPKKKCPKPGVMVKTKAGLVGATTGNCGKRRSVEVALLGVGAAEFRRSELKALTKNQTARLKAELKRVPKLGPTRRGRSRSATVRLPVPPSSAGGGTLPAFSPTYHPYGGRASSSQTEAPSYSAAYNPYGPVSGY